MMKKEEEKDYNTMIQSTILTLKWKDNGAMNNYNCIILNIA